MTQVAYQPEFNESFPPLEFDFVEVQLTEDDPQFDRDRSLAFSHLLGRPITYVRPPFKLHNSEIRKLVKEKGREWREFIPKGAYEIFEEIGGPHRINEVS